MNDDEYAFLDTNVLIYSVSNDVAKKQRAIELLNKKNVIISTQIISESINVMYRKLNYNYFSFPNSVWECLPRRSASNVLYYTWKPRTISFTQSHSNNSYARFKAKIFICNNYNNNIRI